MTSPSASSVSTHVLDAVGGRPAAALPVSLFDADHIVRGSGLTDADGRLKPLAEALAPGVYRIVFDTGKWFHDNNIDGYYPDISVTFEIRPGDTHHHIPILLSPYSYTTYRGS